MSPVQVHSWCHSFLNQVLRKMRFKAESLQDEFNFIKIRTSGHSVNCNVQWIIFLLNVPLLSEITLCEAIFILAFSSASIEKLRKRRAKGSLIVCASSQTFLCWTTEKENHLVTMALVTILSSCRIDLISLRQLILFIKITNRRLIIC